MSARSLMGWGVSRRAIVLVSAAIVAGLGGLASDEKTVSCSLKLITRCQRARKRSSDE